LRRLKIKLVSYYKDVFILVPFCAAKTTTGACTKSHESCSDSPRKRALVPSHNLTELPEGKLAERAEFKFSEAGRILGWTQETTYI
jgi:hypothetical protein